MFVSGVKEIDLNPCFPHTTSFHIVILGCSMCRICILRYFQFTTIFGSLPHKLCLCFILQHSAFHFPYPLPESLAVCHPSPGEPTWILNMRLAHLDILLLSGIFPYIFLSMSHMFISEARKVLRKEDRKGEVSGGRRENQKRDKNPYFCFR